MGFCPNTLNAVWWIMVMFTVHRMMAWVWWLPNWSLSLALPLSTVCCIPGEVQLLSHLLSGSFEIKLMNIINVCSKYHNLTRHHKIPQILGREFQIIFQNWVKTVTLPKFFHSLPFPIWKVVFQPSFFRVDWLILRGGSWLGEVPSTHQFLYRSAG